MEQSRYHLHVAEETLDHVLEVNKTLRTQREDAVRVAANLEKRVKDSKMDVNALREKRDKLSSMETSHARFKLKLCIRCVYVCALCVIYVCNMNVNALREGGINCC